MNSFENEIGLENQDKSFIPFVTESRQEQRVNTRNEFSTGPGI